MRLNIFDDPPLKQLPHVQAGFQAPQLHSLSKKINHRFVYGSHIFH